MKNTNVCLSGGALGADKLWGEYALKNKHELIHFIFPSYKNNYNHGVMEVLSLNDLKKADEYIIRANNTLKRRFPSKSDYVNNLLRRNYYQIAITEKVYAISTLDNNGKIEGGTAWATQMYIDLCVQEEKECFLYLLNQNDNLWYKFNINKNIFEITDNIPKPSGIWTGIGTRNLTQNSKEQIHILMS